jgi:hypothetical protein
MAKKTNETVTATLSPEDAKLVEDGGIPLAKNIDYKDLMPPVAITVEEAKELPNLDDHIPVKIPDLFGGLRPSGTIFDGRAGIARINQNKPVRN